MQNDFISVSSVDAKPIQETWAAYVRQRWPQNALAMIQREWDLTEGEARNLLYAHGSLNTIDRIGRHKNGGLKLEFDMLLNRWRMTLEGFADQQERERSYARDLQEARAKSERLALSRLAGREGVEP